MNIYHEILNLNESILTNNGNLTKSSNNLIFWDTTSENYHTLNNKFSDGFILISKNLNQHADNDKINLLDRYRKNINDNHDNKFLKICICQELNATINKNTLISLIKHYNRFLGISSLQKCFYVKNDLLIFEFNYNYIIIESKLIPLSLEDVREAIYLLSIRDIKLNKRIIFIVKDKVDEEINDKSETIIYVILSPKNKCNDNNFDVSIIYLPTGYLENLSNMKQKRIPMSNLITNCNSLENSNFELISRYDIINETQNSNIFKEELMEVNYSEEEKVILNEKLYSKSIYILQETYFIALIRWNLGIHEIVYPDIPKPDYNDINDGLFLLKIDTKQTQDKSLILIISGLDFLEWLIKNYFEDSVLTHETYSEENINSEISEFINKVSEIWGYSILNDMGIFELNKENKSSINNKIFSECEINRLDVDYTDYFWYYIKEFRDISKIYKIFTFLINELEKFFMQQFYDNKFIPQIRSENNTIFANLIKSAIQIHRLKLYENQKYNLKQEHNTDIKEQIENWNLIKKNYFEKISYLKYVLIQIGFECIINDMKLIIKKSQPLLNDEIFDWHLNELYLESTNLLKNLDIENLNKINEDLLLRIRMLLPVCYVSQVLSSKKFTWDISKKFIYSSIKYYSDPNNFNNSTIFAIPVYNRNLIAQYVNSKSPDQIEILSSNYENSISLNKINHINLIDIQNNSEEYTQLFNQIPMNIWKISSEINSSNMNPNYYSIQIQKKLN